MARPSFFVLTGLLERAPGATGSSLFLQTPLAKTKVVCDTSRSCPPVSPAEGHDPSVDHPLAICFFPSREGRFPSKQLFAVSMARFFSSKTASSPSSFRSFANVASVELRNRPVALPFGVDGHFPFSFFFLWSASPSLIFGPTACFFFAAGAPLSGLLDPFLP